MKIFLLSILIINIYASDLKDRIEKLTIAPQKTNIIYEKYDPFQSGKEVVMKTVKAKKQESALHVMTILNNKVFIDSRWYKVGDVVKEYKIMQITKYSILANKNGKVIKIGIKKSDKLLKIRDKKQ